MRYEKKMLILSGMGKGVVLMEKSALGVKFALRTFSVPATAGLKVGVIARSCVVVRELPSCADPSLVFYIDDSALDLSYLHFAVFDSALMLYGATGKRMWESNLMDLLVKADRLTAPPPILEQSVELSPLPQPPIKNRLPDPDGSGNPQLRALYGDDLIAGDNYYTPFDISSRMKDVDGFLDTPRVLDGLSPSIEKPTALPTSKPPRASNEFRAESARRTPEEKTIEPSSEETDMTDITDNSDTAKPVESVLGSPDIDELGDIDDDPIQEAAAATVDTTKPLQMWERSAQYLNTLDTGELVVKRETVAAIAPKEQVKRVREATFFEKCRADVDKLFSSATKDGELNAILPDIDWIKVPFDGHNTVSVGRGGDVFLCYAVPGVYEKVSPLGGEAQWLPKHKNAPTGRGYWLIFQDLKSGGIIGV